MKKRLLSLIIVFCSAIAANSQEKIDDIILDIRKKYQLINAEKNSYFSNDTTDEDNQDSGGVYFLTRKTKNSYFATIRLIEYKNFQSQYKSNEPENASGADESYYLYFYQNKPVFYAENVGMDGHPPYYKTKIAYFLNGSLFLCQQQDNYDDIVTKPNEINDEFGLKTVACQDFLADDLDKYLANNVNNAAEDKSLEINRIKSITEKIAKDKRKFHKNTVVYSDYHMEEKTLDYKLEESHHIEKIVYYDDLRLITNDFYFETNVYNETNEGKEEFYFYDGNLFFYYLQSFNKKLDQEGITGDNVITGYEKRIYIHENKPVRILEKKVEQKKKNRNELKIKEVKTILAAIKNSNLELNEKNFSEIRKYIRF